METQRVLELISQNIVFADNIIFRLFEELNEKRSLAYNEALVHSVSELMIARQQYAVGLPALMDLMAGDCADV